MSISVATVDFLFVSLCFQRNLLLALDFFKSHAEIVSRLFHSLSSAALASGIFHCWRHGDELVHQIVMGHRSKSLTCNVIFMVLGLRRFCSLSLGFMGFHISTFHCFGILLECTVRLCNHFRGALLSFARHGWSHKSFQFSPRILENYVALFVIWIDKVNS